MNQDLLTAIENLGGGKVVSSHPGQWAVRASLPASAIEEFAGLPSVQTIRLADDGETLQSVNKENTTEGFTAHQADLAHQVYGVEGTGIDVGVISNGVDTLAARQASGDLPANVIVLPDQAGSGDEGTAMLEIGHDLAPKAQLYYATGIGIGQEAFAENVEALCDAGADTIVDDVVFFAEPAFQDGPIGQAINSVVSRGCIYFLSAGNNGNLDSGEQLEVWKAISFKGLRLSLTASHSVT